jgi:hypothetical protein
MAHSIVASSQQAVKNKKKYKVMHCLLYLNESPFVAGLWV